MKSRNDDIVKVPCGRCPACAGNHSLQWYVRLRLEAQYSDYTTFVTLTYDDEHLLYQDVGNETIAVLHKPHLQQFFGSFRDRLKKIRRVASKQKKTLKNEFNTFRYFAVGEYGGGSYRPHYHAIAYTDFYFDCNEVASCWNHGNVAVEPIRDFGALRYCSLDIGNQLEDSVKSLFDKYSVQRPFRLMSTRPPIGHVYYDRNQKWHKQSLDRQWIYLDGQKYRLPRLFRDKIYDSWEKYQIRKSAHEWGLEQDQIQEAMGDRYEYNPYILSQEKLKFNLKQKTRYTF